MRELSTEIQKAKGEVGGSSASGIESKQVIWTLTPVVCIITVTMNYSTFIKKLTFPASFTAPTELTFEDLTAKTLTREDLKADMDAVNSSLELIRNTRGGSWPQEAVTEEFDFLDLAWHEREFRDGTSFAYAVYSDSGEYLGCLYLYPMGVRTPLTERLEKYEIDVSWWVTAKAYESGYYEKLHFAIKEWIKLFPVNSVYYSNKEIPS